MTRLVWVIVLCIATAGSAAAQNSGGSWDPTGLQHTRAELEALLSQYEQIISSRTYSDRMRDRARAEAELIRQRLTEGDLRVGDRIDLVVEGQPGLTNTFTVVAGRLIVLPDLAMTPTEVPLDGVLRSELQAHLESFIARYIRNPVVRARSLVRLEIMGAVANPGFFMLAPDILISDALMAAGGLSGSGDIDQVRIERGGEVIWGGEQVRDALREGRTLDQMSIRAGDAIYVGQKGSRFANVRTVLGVLSSLSALFWVGRRTGVF